MLGCATCNLTSSTRVTSECPKILEEMGRVAKENALAALLTATACLHTDEQCRDDIKVEPMN